MSHAGSSGHLGLHPPRLGFLKWGVLEISFGDKSPLQILTFHLLGAWFEASHFDLGGGGMGVFISKKEPVVFIEQSL